MKHPVLSLFAFLFFTQFSHAQIFIGAKAGYDRYFSPGSNGGNVNLLLEYPFGPHHCFSARGGFFTGIPIHSEEKGVSFPSESQDPDNPFFANQFEQVGSMKTSIRYAGLFGEFLCFFRGDAFKSNVYSIVRLGASYTSITRKIGGVDESLVVPNINFQDDDQFSIYAGLGAGYQFALGKEKRSVLFTEVILGVPFFTFLDGEIYYYGKTFPIFSVSGNIGYKFYIGTL